MPAANACAASARPANCRRPSRRSPRPRQPEAMGGLAMRSPRLRDGGGLMHGSRPMESTPRWIAVAVGVAVLALGACTATGPTQARGEPELRFSSPPDNGNASRDERGEPVRVRLVAFGRRIRFREVSLEPNGASRQAGHWTGL